MIIMMMDQRSDSSSMAAPILRLRDLITPLFLSADKSLFSLSHKSKLLHLLRWVLFSLFFLILHLFRSLSFFVSSPKSVDDDVIADQSSKATGAGDSAIGRALHQLLSLVGEIPVSSRKYDAVRSLAERLIRDNLKEDSLALREINCAVLSAAFSRTLAQLEAGLLGGRSGGNWFGLGPGSVDGGLGRAVRAVSGWYMKASARSGPNEDAVSAEKMAAELLWLAQKLEESGGVEVAVEKWAWASKLGWVALTAEHRVQASLVKLTAFLIKQAKDMGTKQDTEGRATDEQKQTKLKMLMTWLPLLCRAHNGADAPTLSSNEREEIERALEGIIDMLEEEENQEKVLALWLHNFTHCPSSDWPNLYGSYNRWCAASRQLLLTRSR